MLAIICNFVAKKQIVISDNKSILDMTRRYQNPPFTMAFPACMRMTIQDTNELNEILKEAHTLLASTEVTPLMTPIAKAHLENNDVD